MQNQSSDPPEDLRALISGYVDGELDDADRARVEQYARAHPAFQRELDDMRALVDAAEAFEPDPVPDELWDAFADGVYNRLERRMGWGLTLVGVLGLLALALYFIVVMPWAPPAVKFLVEVMLLGLGILFLSVLRQRFFMLKSDRYSRDIKR